MKLRGIPRITMTDNLEGISLEFLGELPWRLQLERTTVVSRPDTIVIQSTIGAILLGSGDTKRVLCGFGRWSYDLVKLGLILEENFVENSVMVGDITSGADKKLLVKSNEKMLRYSAGILGEIPEGF